MSKINNISNAFLDFAEKQPDNEKIINDLIIFNNLYSKNSLIKTLILSTRISVRDKNQILSSSIGSKISKSVIEFILYLSLDKSIKQLSKIVKIVETNFKDRQGIIDVDVISPINLDPQLINDISGFIKNKHSKKAIISEIIDPNLIAGIKLKIGNTILDGTVSNKLKKLKTNLLNNSN